MSSMRNEARTCGCACPGRRGATAGRSSWYRLGALGWLLIGPLGCAMVQPHPSSSPPAQTSVQVMAQPEAQPILPATTGDELAKLMRFGSWMHRLSETRQRQLLARLERAQHEHPSDLSQARLAMVLALPMRSFADPQRAQSLLQALRADPAASDDLKAFVDYRLALADEQRALESARLECARALQVERNERKALETKLEALKAIEKKMNASDKPQPVPLR